MVNRPLRANKCTVYNIELDPNVVYYIYPRFNMFKKTPGICFSFCICCWLVRGSLFIELGCPRDLGKGWRGNSDWLKFSIWNGVMGKQPIRANQSQPHANLMLTLCQPCANLMPTSCHLVPTLCQPCANLKPPRANLVPTLCKPHANLMQTSCHLMPTSCQPHANLMQTSCQPCANLMPTSCKPHVVLGYHWLPLATINLVGDNRELEV